MAKKRRKSKSKPKTIRCKNRQVFRAKMDCTGKRGRNACHPDFVKVGKSKYTARGGKLGSDRQFARGTTVAVCKVGRKLKAVSVGGDHVALRRIGR